MSARCAVSLEALVQGVTESSAEEFYTWCIANAATLAASCRQHAEEGNGVAAVAAAVGSDLSALQSWVWERVNIAPRSPQRQFFEVGQTVADALRDLDLSPLPQGSTAADLVRSLRRRVEASFDRSLAAEVEALWSTIPGLEGLPAPTGDDFDAAVGVRLGGMSPDAFLRMRRAAASEEHRAAQSARIRAEATVAISAAYQGDLLLLEAYLVESALATGDDRLLSVFIRWDLVSRALSDLAGLPDDVVVAVAEIRHVIVHALGVADGARWLETVPTV